MKIVTPTYEILEHPEQENQNEVYQFIERIGRVCYKSEDKITDKSAVFFCEKLRNSKHWAMLEHFRFTFASSREAYDKIIQVSRYPVEGDTVLPMLHHFILTTVNKNRPADRQAIITCSATALNYLVTSPTLRDDKYRDHPINQLFDLLLQWYPALMAAPKNYVSPVHTDSFTALTKEEVLKLDTWEATIHGWMSVMFRISRGTTHELVRSRNHVSYAMESTRYCNYSKGRFGTEITVVRPPLADLDGVRWNIWVMGCEMAELAYFNMIRNGCSAQIARELLPHAVKADIVVTAPYAEWKHIFDIRVPVTAHPAIREVMGPLLSDKLLDDDRMKEIFAEQIILVPEESL